MGSGYGTRKCRICERDAMSCADTRTLEFSVQCFYCGYTYEEYILTDRKREKETGKWFPKLRKNGDPIWRIRQRIGYGVCNVATLEGGGAIGGITKPLTPKDIKRFSRGFNGPEIDLEKSYLLSFDPKTKELTAIIGEIPEEPLIG